MSAPSYRNKISRQAATRHERQVKAMLILAGIAFLVSMIVATAKAETGQQWIGYYSAEAARQCTPVTIWRSADGREFLVTAVSRMPVPKDRDAVRMPVPLVEFVGRAQKPARCVVLRQGVSR